MKNMDNKAKYTFYSWLRRGFATQLDHADPLSPSEEHTIRSNVKLNLDIFSAGKALASIPKQLSLYGPGDIMGIESRAIVKTEPHPGVTNYESNYFPYIEFYDEDFPWRYTPAAPNGDRLRPWLALIVLEPEEFEALGLTNSRLPAIHIKNGALKGPFPPPDQTWAWAHVQLNEAIPSQNAAVEVENLLQSNPNAGSSRLICPRKLKANTNYRAFLIPSFEQGRLAGLGAKQDRIQSANMQAGSWGQIHDWQPDQWPVYYEWGFRTGALGDFESLVRRLEPRSDLDERIGRKLVDIQSPGYGLQFKGKLIEAQKGTIYITGALRLPSAIEPPLTDQTDTDSKNFLESLMDLINLDEDLKDKSVGDNFLHNPYFPEEENNSIYDDPIITPPFYGKHHSGQKRVAHNDRWYNQLNLDPKYRLAAGLGAQVVQKDQESLMERAWLQFGDIIEANRQIRQEQMSLALSKALYKKHVQSDRMSILNLMVLTEKLHPKVRTGEKTVFRSINQSLAVSDTFVHPLYTKLTRSRGPLVRRLNSRRQKVIFQEKRDWANWSMMGLTAFQAAGANLAMPNMVLKMTVAQAPVPPLIKAHFDRGRPAPTLSAILKTAVNLNTMKASILQKTDPIRRFRARMNTSVVVPAAAQVPKFTTNKVTIEEIMAAPEFPDPMYKTLTALDTDYLVPNLELLPPDSIALLENNEAFIESYLVGLNYEMGRELLWREFPTDQRGTYFSQFWDASDNLKAPSPDIRPIHQWPLDSILGDASHSPGQTSSELVLTIRGELLRKYPNTIIYMQRASWVKKKLKTRKLNESNKSLVFPLFHAQVPPDIFFLGFDKTVEEARGNDQDPGWFFILKERSGEVRFGLDLDVSEEVSNWDNLSWHDFPDVKHCLDLNRDLPPPPLSREASVWGKGENATMEDPASGNGHAADMAYILCQKPFMVAVHATELLGDSQ